MRCLPALPTYPARPQRREQLPLDAEMPLLGVRGLVRERVADHPRVGGVQLGGGPRLDRHDGRKRVVDGAHGAEVERVGLELTFCEIVYGTFWSIRLPADGCSGKYVMPKPVRSTFVMSPVRP